MRQFVTTFNYDKNQVIFQLNTVANDGSSAHHKLSGGAIFAIVLVSVLSLVIFMFGTRKLRMQN